MRVFFTSVNMLKSRIQLRTISLLVKRWFTKFKIRQITTELRDRHNRKDFHYLLVYFPVFQEYLMLLKAQFTLGKFF